MQSGYDIVQDRERRRRGGGEGERDGGKGRKGERMRERERERCSNIVRLQHHYKLLLGTYVRGIRKRIHYNPLDFKL